MSDYRVRWGIIGAGIIAEHFCSAVRLVEGCEVIAAASKSARRAEEFARKNGVPEACTYDELAGHPEVDAVYVATTHNFHAENVRTALERGKPVLVEKPFTVNAAEAESLVRLARERGLFLMEAMWVRFLPSHIRLRETLASGAIGDVRQVSVSFGNVAAPQYAGRLVDIELAGGVTLDMGCYPLSFISNMLGEIPEEVHALGRKARTGVDETADYALRYPSGALGLVSTSFNLRMKNEAVFYGTEGYALFDFPNRSNSFTVHRYGGEGGAESAEDLHCEGAENGFVYQVREVQRCLEAGLTESPGMPIDESTALMGVMDRIRRDLGLVYPFESPEAGKR